MCGHKLNPNDRFCGDCGNKIVKEVETSDQIDETKIEIQLENESVKEKEIDSDSVDDEEMKESEISIKTKYDNIRAILRANFDEHILFL